MSTARKTINRRPNTIKLYIDVAVFGNSFSPSVGFGSFETGGSSFSFISFFTRSSMANCSAAIDSDTSSSVSIVSKDASAATIASCKAANEPEVYTPSSFDILRALEINAFNSVRSTLGSSDSSFSTKLSMANCNSAIASDTSSSVSAASKDASATSIASCKEANESVVYTSSSFEIARASEINASNLVRSNFCSLGPVLNCCKDVLLKPPYSSSAVAYQRYVVS